VTVERLDGVGGAVSVDYGTSDGSASDSSDYEATSGTLHWAAGDSGDKTFTVPVSWDGRAEGSETVNLALTNPGGGSELGANTVATISIGDDGASGALVLNSVAYSVGEADGLVTVTVTRSGGSLGGPVAVDYATSDGTATAGSDYTAASGTLEFGPGEDTKTFTVPVTSDAGHEGDETLQVALSNASGGANVGSPAGATVTITDDDAAPAVPAPADPPPSGPAPAASDTAAPKLTVAAKRIQRALKSKRLQLSARCDEQCNLAVVARVRLGTKKIVLGRARATAASGRAAAMRIKLSRKALVKLRRAMKRGKARVVFSVSAADAAGNGVRVSRRITAKR
jgi:Calx-beta domain